jgi:cytochrome c553
MRKAIYVASLLALLPLGGASTDVAVAGANPPWAYPVAPQNLPARDPNKIITVPGSDKKYNEVEVNNPFGPPDWFPGDHAPMPKVVATGNRPEPRACSLCHLTSGDGHPESAGVAGLPVGYFIRQLQEFANGGRVGIRANPMIQITRGMSAEDMQESARYFAGRQPRVGYVKVVEAATVPKTYVGAGGMRFVSAGADAGTEPIGQRIITIPQDEAAKHARNPRVGFDHLVPPGSIKKGEELATTGGGGKTVPWAICHGPGLKGLGDVPPIANRDLLYTFRQLNDIQNGARSSSSAALMRPVVAKLTAEDMINLAAYVGSLNPWGSHDRQRPDDGRRSTFRRRQEMKWRCL